MPRRLFMDCSSGISGGMFLAALTALGVDFAPLEEALRRADAAEPLDLIAPMLREAVNALGEITGEVSTADILETMFSRFCVGK